ncbi:DUF3105 domain-containing protein [Nocardioides sp. T2.26MG-1]|uniref:DUF3105 domain-containing protein n=1 Tax=Nocardioides sp. T2.26MG-1 TaxID=3041166 RepID=UPI002541E896|nr:DUF3105 domain-containing protein [Nocardioides sp. T2.26MG-1]
MVALILVAVGLWGLAASDKPPARETAEKSAPAGVKEYDVVADHVITEVEYEQTPPVGGAHNPLWLNCGAYDDPVFSENAVHSMEHGAVWITYDPALDEAAVAKLEESLPSTYAILSPFEGLPSPVVASAWGRQLVLESPDDPQLEEFIAEYRNGGVAPEIGAPCTGASDGTLPLDAVETME